MGAVRSILSLRHTYIRHPSTRRSTSARNAENLVFISTLLLDQVGVIPVGDVYCGFQSTTLCGINVGVGGIPGSFKPNSRRSPCRACVAVAARRMVP